MSTLLSERWSPHQHAAGERYRKLVEHALARQLGDVTGSDLTALDEDRRAVVEMVVLLDLAARLAQDRLRIGSDDFAVTACEVFDQR